MRPSQVAVPVHERSQAGEARRAAAWLSDSVGLSAEDAGRVAIVVTEAAANLRRMIVSMTPRSR